jgi:hypothetical protein
MGKYNNKKQVAETKLADHKRVCRNCSLISYHWICCGQRTARLNMEGNKPEFKVSPVKS